MPPGVTTTKDENDSSNWEGEAPAEPSPSKSWLHEARREPRPPDPGPSDFFHTFRGEGGRRDGGRGGRVRGSWPIDLQFPAV